jgi:hypothetical protein
MPASRSMPAPRVDGSTAMPTTNTMGIFDCRSVGDAVPVEQLERVRRNVDARAAGPSLGEHRDCLPNADRVVDVVDLRRELGPLRCVRFIDRFCPLPLGGARRRVSGG